MKKLYPYLGAYSQYIPARLRSLIRSYIPLTDFDVYKRRQKNPYADDSPCQIYEGSPVTLGIIHEPMHYHKSNIAACRDMKVSYKLLDLFRDDWISVINDSDCDAFLAWPPASLSIWKQMFDDRLRIMEEELGKIVYPSARELWYWENKRRVKDWLTANDIPAPRTWIFYNEADALDFLSTAVMPVVFKSNLGASAKGVRIFRDRSDARRFVRRLFSKGFLPRGRHPLDKEWGVVYLQEYLSDVNEWRMIRIGDSYFGYRKEKVGEYHSGSGAWSWLDPPRPLLDLLRKVTDKGNFTSMNVDIFETSDGRLLVNELQAVFGATTPAEMLCVNGEFGRYLYDATDDQWRFDKGDYSRNMCANIRVEYLVNQMLSARLKGNWLDDAK